MNNSADGECFSKQEVDLLSEVIRTAYANTFSRDAWRQILELMTGLICFDALGVTFLNVPSEKLARIVTWNVDADFLEWHLENTPALEAIAGEALTRGLRVWRPSEVVGEQEWQRSPIRKSLQEKFGFNQPIIITCGSAKHSVARVWSVREIGTEDYRDRDKHILGLLQQHFCEALHKSGALIAYQDIFEHAIRPTFICDSLGQIMEMNASARQLTNDGDGEDEHTLTQLEAAASGMIARHKYAGSVQLQGQRYRFNLSPAASGPTSYVAEVETTDHLTAINREMKKYRLSEREAEICTLLVRGLPNRQIGEELFIAECTVKDHVTHILKKLDVPCRSGVVAKLLGY